MDLSYKLLTSTPSAWADAALRDFPRFLQDHASCERKASAVGLSFVVRYPDRTLLIEPMIHFAREELEHFHQVYKLMIHRGIPLVNDEPDEYVNQLMQHVRTGRQERFLDRLLVSSVIEARGHERLGIVADTLTEPALKDFYRRLATAEGHHQDLFLKMAELYFPEDKIEERLIQLLEVESEAMVAAPFRSALH